MYKKINKEKKDKMWIVKYVFIMHALHIYWIFNMHALSSSYAFTMRLLYIYNVIIMYAINMYLTCM